MGTRKGTDNAINNGLWFAKSAMKESLKKIKLFKSLMLYLRTD